MIYEQLPFKVDIARLREHLESHVLSLPAVSRGEFDGWSVLSSNGSYLDGWEYGSLCVREVDGRQFIDYEAAEKMGVKDVNAYRVPTEICTGYLASLIRFFVSNGLNIRRARIAKLAPGTASQFHRDAPDSQYAVRLHIPIITNDGCLFECDEGAAHLPADGSVFLLRVNRLHRVVNTGETARYHFIADVRDRGQVSQFHRFEFKGTPAKQVET